MQARPATLRSGEYDMIMPVLIYLQLSGARALQNIPGFADTEDSVSLRESV